MDINVKKQLIAILFTVILSVFFNIDAQAVTFVNPDEIYLTPGGETIGIELDTSVIVVDTYEVKGLGSVVNPAKTAGIKPGDVILYIDGKKINKIEDIRSELMKYKNGHDQPLSIIIKRDNKLLNKKMYPARTKDNALSLGIYLRDNIMGIGTLTFVYDNKFGALGHQIQDRNLPELNMSKARGVIRNAEVTSINKSSRGNPGEKRATFGKDSIGTITDNKTTGIYGQLNSAAEFYNKEKMPIATQKDIKLGDATILTVVDKNKIEEFKVKIIELIIQDEKNVKGIKLQITDERLLNKTGGIVQGMSGSPIIQNDHIVGAVTHVLVDDTTIGYGVYIEFMLEDMGISVRD